MDCCLGERLGNDGRLLKFNAETKVDDWMQEACIQAREKIYEVSSVSNGCTLVMKRLTVSTLVASQKIPVHNIRVASLFYFALEKNHVIVVIFLIAQILLELGSITKILQYGFVKPAVRTLITGIDVVRMLDISRISPQRPYGQKMMGNVVVKA